MISPVDSKINSSLQASQSLSGSLSKSFQAAKPLLDRLHQWRASAHPNRPTPENGYNNLPPSLHLAYLLLLIYIYRALLRPTVKNKQPREIIDLESFDFDALMSFDFPHWTSVTESLPAESVPDPSGSDDLTANSLGTLYQAAQGCARGLLEFTRGLSCIDLASFWFSCENVIDIGNDLHGLLITRRDTICVFRWLKLHRASYYSSARLRICDRST